MQVAQSTGYPGSSNTGSHSSSGSRSGSLRLRLRLRPPTTRFYNRLSTSSPPAAMPWI